MAAEALLGHHDSHAAADEKIVQQRLGERIVGADTSRRTPRPVPLLRRPSCASLATALERVERSRSCPETVISTVLRDFGQADARVPRSPQSGVPSGEMPLMCATPGAEARTSGISQISPRHLAGAGPLSARMLRENICSP